MTERTEATPPPPRPPRRDRRFIWACAASVFLHGVLFAWVGMAPSQPKYRYFGGGTAVSLVGADEIPGGSARGKSGDRPQEAVVRPSPQAAAPARKIAAPEKKPPQPAKKVVQKKKKPPKKVVRKKKKPPKKVVQKKKVRRIAKKSNPKKRVVRKKKKRDPAREARRKRALARRERAMLWRKRYKKTQQSEKQKPARKPSAPENLLARADAVPPKPPKGYAGEGGGDGQGGGSRTIGGGGVERGEMERYYGRLGRWIGQKFQVPPGLDVEGMRTTVEVDINRTGKYRNLRITRSSGNAVYDRAVLRAVEHAASPSLPAPPDGMKTEWLLLGFRFCGKEFCR